MGFPLCYYFNKIKITPIVIQSTTNLLKMKKLLLFAGLLASVTVEAQISKVSLQASGLTCSMCSNAINKSLKTLGFVDKVDADIKTYTFEISFKPGTVVDFDMLKNKVESAGFTVCSFVATIHFDNLKVTSNQSLVMQNKTLLLLGVPDQVLNGEKQVKLLDKGFVSAKEFKKSASLVSCPQCYHITL